MKKFLDKNLLIVLLLGFSSGLPLLLTGSTLKLWLARENVDISVIGYFSWVSMAYSLKFLWAPLVDRYGLPFLGRRRTWILLTQILMALFLFLISQLQPTVDLQVMAIFAVIVAFLSATQDIAIDAYRRELLPDEQLGLGSAFNIYGYRLAMLFSGGVGIGLVGSDWINLTWSGLYTLMAASMIVCGFITWWAPQPADSGSAPPSLISAIVDPFREFLTRENAFSILLFVFLFKLGDAMGAAMLNPFYVQMGFSNADIGFIAKTVGLTAAMVSFFLGGLILYRIGIVRSLWIFGILQVLSTAGFALLTFTGAQPWALAATVIFEDASQGLGTVAFIAYISSLTSKRFTGTQYALLSSVASLGRVFFAGFTGDMQKTLGWAPFFYVCAAIGLLGLGMLWFIQKKVKLT